MLTSNSTDDTAHRHCAVNTFDACICIEAGAGTGKTTLMVNRITELVRSGEACIGNIVAITFTDKAATELRQRLRASLESSLDDFADSPKSDSRVNKLLAEALRGLGTAKICTIHSFARSILATYAAEAGIDPSFDVMNEVEADGLFDSVWRDWLPRMLVRKHDRLYEFFDIGGSTDDLLQLAKCLYINRHRDLIRPISLQRDIWFDLAELRAKASHCLQSCKAPVTDKLAIQVRQFSDFFDRCENLNGWEKSRALMMEQPHLTQKAGSKAGWHSTESLEQCRDAMASVRSHLEDYARSTKEVILWAVFELVGEFISELRSAKSDSGVLSFDDLLLEARNLILKNREVRSDIQRRYTHIMVDEFQDTDSLQAEFIFLLSEASPTTDSWLSVKPQKGKLFIVGDPKQSIYRFRGADIETFESAKNRLGDVGLSLSITRNFRTVPSIIEWVNNAFSNLIARPCDGLYQPDYYPLKASRTQPSEETRVWTIVNHYSESCEDDKNPYPANKTEESSEAERTPVSAMRSAEAKVIAAAIYDLVSLQHIRLGVEGQPVQHKDFAILFPTRNEIDVYQEALEEYHIPFALDGGKRYYVTQEIDYLISLLRAIHNPRDEVSVVAALRSPHFGLTDDEILQHRILCKSFVCDNPCSQETCQSKSVRLALDTMKRLRMLRRDGSLAELVDAALRQTWAVEIAATRPGGQQAILNLLKLVDLARDYESTGRKSLSAFIDWLSDHRKHQTAEAESQAYETSDNVVNLMTIHKSKGLEFPVVILAGLMSTKNDYPLGLYDAERRVLELKLGSLNDGFVSAGYQQALERDRKREKAESVRLLYVAVTRARELLIIPALSVREKSLLSLLEPYLHSTHRYSPQCPPPVCDTDRDDSSNERASLTVKSLIEVRRAWLENRSSSIEKASRGQPVIIPSAKNQDYDGASGTVEREGEVSHTAGGGISTGIAYHELMAYINPIGNKLHGDGLETAISTALEVLNIYDVDGELAKLVRSTVSLDEVRELAETSVASFVEVPFSLQLGPSNILCEGVMDLVCEHDDGSITVVDYKSDRVNLSTIESRFNTYHEQGLWYGQAIEAALPGSLRQIMFIFGRIGVVKTIQRIDIKLASVQREMEKDLVFELEKTGSWEG